MDVFIEHHRRRCLKNYIPQQHSFTKMKWTPWRPYHGSILQNKFASEYEICIYPVYVVVLRLLTIVHLAAWKNWQIS